MERGARVQGFRSAQRTPRSRVGQPVDPLAADVLIARHSEVGLYGSHFNVKRASRTLGDRGGRPSTYPAQWTDCRPFGNYGQHRRRRPIALSRLGVFLAPEAFST